jgi:hypothetical protein
MTMLYEKDGEEDSYYSNNVTHLIYYEPKWTAVVWTDVGRQTMDDNGCVVVTTEIVDARSESGRD